MIVVYLLSFTVLITSVIKVTDVFFHGNQALQKKQREFIKHTKELHQKQDNQEGNITLMAALLTLMISGLLLFFTLKMKIELKEAYYRKDSYLCFKYLNNQTENYINDMAKFNYALRTLSIAVASGAASAKAKLLFEATKLARNGRHFYYIKTLAQNKYCKNKANSLSYLLNFPFSINTAFLLQTNLDETTILREQQWSTIHYQPPKEIRLKNTFCLRAKFEMEDVFSPNLKITTEEISMVGFSKSKCLSGSQ